MSVGILYSRVLASIEKHFVIHKNKFFCVQIIVLFVFDFFFFVSIIIMSPFAYFLPYLTAQRILFTFLFIPPVSSHIPVVVCRPLFAPFISHQKHYYQV